MRLFIRLAIFFYVFVILLVGFTAMLVLAHVVDFDQYLNFLKFIYFDGNASMIAGIIIAATLIISLVFARIIYGRQRDERLIHFNNPLGKVTISLSALEDLIRRLVVHTPQIKEIHPNILSSKGGLDVEVRLVLRSEANIPELMGDLQETIQRKVQAVIGVEERVKIRVHVIKICGDDARSKGASAEDDEVVSPLPFRGYRA